MSGLEEESVRALGALHSLQSKKKCVVGKQGEMHLLIDEEKEEWVQDYVDTQAFVARTWGENSETAIKQE